jgi:hypothetical protein
MIILHHINEENYSQAIENLVHVDPKKLNEVLYKYCHIFMQYEPLKTIKLLINKVKDFVPTKLIGGLMNIKP